MSGCYLQSGSLPSKDLRTELRNPRFGAKIEHAPASFGGLRHQVVDIIPARRAVLQAQRVPQEFAEVDERDAVRVNIVGSIVERPHLSIVMVEVYAVQIMMSNYAPPVGLHYPRHNLVQLWLRYSVQLQTQQLVRGYLSHDSNTRRISTLPYSGNMVEGKDRLGTQPGILVYIESNVAFLTKWNPYSGVCFIRHWIPSWFFAASIRSCDVIRYRSPDQVGVRSKVQKQPELGF